MTTGPGTDARVHLPGKYASAQHERNVTGFTRSEQIALWLRRCLSASKQRWVFTALAILAWAAASAGVRPVVETTSVSVASELEPLGRVAEFLERRVQDDSWDIVAHNRLADLYLRRWRKTRNRKDLDLALRAARSSLEAVPARLNAGAVLALAQVELETHKFTSARDHARQLIEIDGGRVPSYLILTDALTELGSYDEAVATLRKAESRSTGGSLSDIVSIKVRLAHQAVLHNAIDDAYQHYVNALTVVLQMRPAPEDTITWVHWRLGETEFFRGRYQTAEEHYQAALRVDPKFVPALESLGRVRAARGHLREAIAIYEQAAAIRPDLNLLATLGDLYLLFGRADEAEKQYAHAERIGRQAGTLEHRNLAMFYADHNIRIHNAYALARRDYELRPDIYAADALAWTALKVGDLPRARSAINEALRLGTADARIFYHAGMIALATGDHIQGHAFLVKVQQFNPGFDPLQTPVARKILERLENE